VESGVGVTMGLSEKMCVRAESHISPGYSTTTVILLGCKGKHEALLLQMNYFLFVLHHATRFELKCNNLLLGFG
jgi:hypothetical protein